jgi:predicted DNA binding CopG/RHH family protein
MSKKPQITKEQLESMRYELGRMKLLKSGNMRKWQADEMKPFNQQEYERKIAVYNKALDRFRSTPEAIAAESKRISDNQKIRAYNKEAVKAFNDKIQSAAVVKIGNVTFTGFGSKP